MQPLLQPPLMQRLLVLLRSLRLQQPPPLQLQQPQPEQ
jgi:hypothetical protein